VTLVFWKMNKISGLSARNMLTIGGLSAELQGIARCLARLRDDLAARTQLT